MQWVLFDIGRDYISESHALIFVMSSGVVCPAVNGRVWIGVRVWESWVIAIS